MLFWQMDRQNNPTSYRDANMHRNSKKRWKKKQKKFSSIISCQLWHLKRKSFFFQFLKIFMAIICLTRMLALNFIRPLITSNVRKCQLFFSYSFSISWTNFLWKKRVTRGVPDILFWAKWRLSRSGRSYFFVKRLQLEP